jgi:anti-anti-sigma factor
MKVARRNQQGITVVDLSGRVGAPYADALRELFSSLIDSGEKKILLNLQGLQSWDSLFLGELVVFYVRLLKRGARLCVVHPPGELKEILSVAQVEFPEIFDGENEAVASFHAD